VDLHPKSITGSDERTDHELWAAWRGGDARSGEQLWRRHARSIQRFFRNTVPSAVALDLAQRTIEQGLRAPPPARSVRNFLLGIARHQLFDHLRAEQRKQRRAVDLEALVIDDEAISPEAWLCAKRERRALLHALRRLPLAIQLVLELRYWERLSDGDVAEVLDLPLGTVKSRILAGRVALRDELIRLDASADRLRSTLDSLDQWAARTQAMAEAAAAGPGATRAPGRGCAAASP
jgi:RNA polymerase sigma factor (sigma-70 family)